MIFLIPEKEQSGSSDHVLNYSIEKKTQLIFCGLGFVETRTEKNNNNIP
jgi:hypothetical protein